MRFMIYDNLGKNNFKKTIPCKESLSVIISQILDNIKKSKNLSEVSKLVDFIIENYIEIVEKLNLKMNQWSMMQQEIASSFFPSHLLSIANKDSALFYECTNHMINFPKPN